MHHAKIPRSNIAGGNPFETRAVLIVDSPLKGPENNVPELLLEPILK